MSGPPRRVWVLGGSASGKTTFSRAFAATTGSRHVELDRLYWRENWTPRQDAELRAELDVLLRQPAWVVDGQYAVAVDAFAATADCVVWLDPPLRVSWPRLLRRTLTRLVSGQDLGAGNRESFTSVFGPRSILVFALRLRRRIRADNERLFDALRGGGAVLVRSRTADPVALARSLADGVAPVDR
ncbi:toxin [Actinosynnema pretiosum]|uniref:Toxin n=1 Tax=Actinosynnema pretiosum TaxID=42197 RepID=A0A290Z9Q4_9PSEU|nr:toxin [Actinosynnema pretiosum]ATE55771.1 toxin [Actinosynnema pretiosum]